MKDYEKQIEEGVLYREVEGLAIEHDDICRCDSLIESWTLIIGKDGVAYLASE
jgi:hypothetical protein